ncbi:uncharacterized protein RMCB_6771 [Mycolicibacterium brisbanense]|uniref:Uncharacterized protein n=1 Tax=Mycolicibacterium brisbanense TaxID=146020 RepID=A0A117I864_9MYCO|nr:uncharacterized protein RMCB_6771 [Mycolicibacterium brisbanense]
MGRLEIVHQDQLLVDGIVSELSVQWEDGKLKLSATFAAPDPVGASGGSTDADFAAAYADVLGEAPPGWGDDDGS